MRAALLFARLVVLLAVVLTAGSGWAQRDASATLQQFARQIGLRDSDGFVETVSSLRTTGRLPPRYLTKNEAERRGWRPGADLCRSARGASIGGDRFGNREGLLPSAPRRSWREADLDFFCGERGAKRLLWSSDGLYFVTVDHYRSFRPVPP